MKKIIIVLLATIIMTATVNADETEDRIADLERRVAELERIVAELTGGSDTAEVVLPTGEPVTLAIGTWIVGQDIPAGRYSVVCASGSGSIEIYDSYEDKKNDKFYKEYYYLMDESYMNTLLNAAGDYIDDSYAALYGEMMSSKIESLYLEDGQCIVAEMTSFIFTPI